MQQQRKKWIVFLALLAIAASFRIAIAYWLPNDAPDDGRVYAQMARNILEQHVYSHSGEPPYPPTLIRLPGYPLFLAAIYSVFGHTNNGAVRIAQALVDTATCVLIALLAFHWQADGKRKRATAIAALALAAVCPFTTIYAATILTEVATMFLIMATFLAATFAFRDGDVRLDGGLVRSPVDGTSSESKRPRITGTENMEESVKGSRRFKRSLFWWSITGLLGGCAVFFRPDTGLFVAAIGFTLVITTIWKYGLWPLVLGLWHKPKVENQRPKAKDQRPVFKKIVTHLLVAGTVLSLSFALVLVPWTIRNWRVFHLFQPLAPAHGEMPGEFEPYGYYQWLRTWLDNEQYIGPFEWALNQDPIDIDDVPPSAFDSSFERERVEALLDQYNNPPNSEEAISNGQQSQPTPQPSPTSTPTPVQASKANALANKSEKNLNTNASTKSDEGETEEENDQGNEGETENQPEEPHGPVAMTPELDAAFGQLARERIARHPIRFYIWLPIKRAGTMWLDTHSQYWPFDGDLLPLADLDYAGHQQYWLPLFSALTAIYTLLGIAGAWLLWRSKKFAARRWLLMASLAIIFRLVLFSSIENPEPRYLVEFFPFLSVLGGIAVTSVRVKKG